MPTLTKSKYMKGEQCQRLLWFADRKQLPESSLMEQHRFSQGPIFEKYVKQLYPKGTELGDLDFNIRINRSSLSPKDIKEFGEIPSRGISRLIRVISPDWRFLTTEGSIKS